ncbi:MAG: hypothetical protein KDI42_00450 [Gammaproteobacteria bacterium]|nr:hypothetical protein [Gammaproteobacteria bacterium]
MSLPSMSIVSKRRQRGVILVTVMAMLFVTLLIASALVNHFVVDESAAIERDLAELRVRWAQIGNLDYVLSRAMADGEGLFGFASQNALQASLEGYLGEVPSLTYTDVAGGGSYSLTSNAQVWDLGVNGRMRIELGITDPGAAVPAAIGLNTRVPSLFTDVCIGDMAVAARSAIDTCVSVFGLLGNNGIPTVVALWTQTP